MDQISEISNNKKEEKTEPKVESKPNKAVQANTTSVINSPRSTSLSGFFKKQFDQQVKVTPITQDKTVTAGIFKTSSGWQDAKYYLLIDKVEPGTIVRIINPSNNAAIYAKVLGEMSGIRQNQGLNIRISNAAASALGIDDNDKFIVKVNY